MSFRSLGLIPPKGGSQQFIEYVDEKRRCIKTPVAITMVSMESDVFMIRFIGNRVCDTVMAFRAMHGLPPHWAILDRNDPRRKMIIKRVQWDSNYLVSFDKNQQLTLSVVT